MAPYPYQISLYRSSAIKTESPFAGRIKIYLGIVEKTTPDWLCLALNWLCFFFGKKPDFCHNHLF